MKLQVLIEQVAQKVSRSLFMLNQCSCSLLVDMKSSGVCLSYSSETNEVIDVLKHKLKCFGGPGSESSTLCKSEPSIVSVNSS